MILEIYNGLNVKDDIYKDAFIETLRIFNQATDEGIESASIKLDNEFIYQIKNNNEVFSAFRVHRMQNDMAAQLLDNEGNLKPFEKWAEDIVTISDHYIKRWFETEYNTAVLRAHNAAEWKKFESEQDVYPNLRWMPTTSPTPDNFHRQYWSMKLTLPINHPFWQKHHPGDRWNCKCELRQTDEPETGEVQFEELKPVPNVPGLDNNPGISGQLFSESHPYYTESFPGAKNAVEKTIRNYKRDRIKEIKQEAKTLTSKTFHNKDFNKDIHISMSGVKEWLNQPHENYYFKNELLLNIDKLISNSKYLGYGDDKHDPEGKAHLFETIVSGKKSWIIVRESYNGEIKIHSISDSIGILNILKKVEK